MPALQGPEACRVEGLGADRDPVDATGYEYVHQLGRDGLGIAFDGELAAARTHGRQIEPGRQLRQQRFPEVRAKEARSAAADKDGPEGKSPGVRSQGGQ